MKFLKAILVLIVLLPAAILKAQDKPVVIDGKQYYIHTVERGHTLYAISKKYSVDIACIIKENPNAEQGVKVGDRLKIPVDKINKEMARTPAPDINNGALLHTVSPKETVYSISKRYNIDPSDLLQANPGISAGLKEGMQLQIPAGKAKFIPSSSLIPADDGSSIIHKVNRQETLYSLAKQYNVTIEEITELNGGLNQGLREGMMLRIPRKTASKSGEVRTTAPNNPFQTTQTLANSQDKPNTGGYKVAMLLPFEIEKLDTLPKLGHDQIALEFYQGAMIAIDSLRQLGVSLDLYIYDTKKDASLVKSLLKKPELQGTDLFIGPMYKSELVAISDVVGKSGAHVVCPVPQAGGILMNRPFLSKAHCDDATQIKELGRYIATRHGRDNTVLIGPSTSTPEKLAFNFIAAYHAAKEGAGHYVKDSIRRVIGDAVTQLQIEAQLQTGRQNIIYIASNQFSFVSSMLSKLTELADHYNITVFGNEDWLKFEQISFATKSKLNLHLPMASYVDYDSPIVKNFLAHYREKYGTDPNKYGFLGYDVTFYYLLGLHRQGREFFNNLNESDIKLTSTKFKMEKLSNDVGFNNFGTYIVRYRDYKIEVVE